MKYKAFLFDLDHTLGIDNHLERDVLKKYAAKNCLIPPSDTDIHKTLEEFRTGKSRKEKALTEAFKRWHFQGRNYTVMVKEFLQEVLQEAPSRLKPLPGASELLKTLKREKFPTAILTNGWSELQKLKAELLGFFGPVIVSEEINAWKPSPQAFNTALKKLKWEASTTLYIGDSPEADVAGAKQAGMGTAWANLEKKKYPQGGCPPDLIITNLDQLLPLISEGGCCERAT